MSTDSASPGLSNISVLFERSLADSGIPPCPDLLIQFMNEMRKAEPDYNRLARIINADVGLSAALIKTANSPFFGVRQRVQSTSETLMLLGLETASQVVAGIVLRNAFPHSPRLERFWDASARTARVSGWLSQQLGLPEIGPDIAYTYGLFHDSGIPVLLGRFPQYAEILARANRETRQGFTEIEQAALKTDHAQVGSMLAQSWWLPEGIFLPIRHHHSLAALEQEDGKLSKSSRMLIAIVQLAEHLSQKQLGLAVSTEWEKLGSVSLMLLNLDESALEKIYSEAVSIVAPND